MLQLSSQELPNEFHEPRALFQVPEVARLRKCVPSDLGEKAEKRLHDEILSFVVPAVQQQRRHVDLRDVVDNRPCLQRSRHEELRWPEPGKMYQ